MRLNSSGRVLENKVCCSPSQISAATLDFMIEVVKTRLLILCC
jgi:hypothetical protein